MIVFPPSKINLGLNVVEKRPDNFHNIETVFYPVQWCDILEIVKADKFKFSQSGLTVEGDPNSNLCVKAYNLLLDDYKLSPVEINLHKNIPMGAGLGGGSSDAAHTLLLLNEIFLLNLTLNQLTEYCIKLGSDCVFFLHQQPMIGKEKGNKLLPVNIYLKNYFIVIVMPHVQINTADAYSMVTPGKPKMSIEEIIKLPVHEWKNILVNDFETFAFAKYPVIKTIKEKIYGSGAIYSSMSGSGASVYGLFEKEINLESAFNDCTVWQVKL